MIITFFTIVILYCFYSNRRVTLGKLFLFYYFLYFVCPYILVKDLSISLESEIFLTAVLVIFFSGYIIKYKPRKSKRIGLRTNEKVVKRELKYIKVIFKISLLASIASIFIHLITNGIQLSNYFNGFYSVAHSYVKLRYSGNLIISIWTLLAFTLSYTVSFLGGFIIVQDKRSLRFLLVSLFPTILMTLLMGTKGILLSGVNLMLGGVLYSLAISNMKIRKLNLKSVVNIIPLVTLIVLVISAAFFSKGLYNYEGNPISLVLSKTISYFTSHLYAFDDWFVWYSGGKSNMNYLMESQLYGNRTFYAIYDIFGGQSSQGQIPGFIEEIHFPNGQKTNLYTVFRGLIEDFSLIGSLLFIMLLGLVSSFFDRNCRKMKLSSLFIYLLLLWFFSNLFAISAFNWKSTFSTTVAILLVFVGSKLRFKTIDNTIH